MLSRYLLCLLSFCSFSSFAQTASDLNLVRAHVSGITVTSASPDDMNPDVYRLRVHLQVQRPNSCYYYVGKEVSEGEQEGAIKITAFLAMTPNGCSEMVSTVAVETTLIINPSQNPIVELSSKSFLFQESTLRFLELN